MADPEAELRQLVDAKGPGVELIVDEVDGSCLVEIRQDMLLVRPGWRGRTCVEACTFALDELARSPL